MTWVHIVIVLALLEYLVFGMLVGRARMKYAIAAPAVSGHSMFERYFRVHQNTLEQMVIFIPAVLLFGRYLSPIGAAVLGVIYLLGRIVYAAGYVRAPEKRLRASRGADLRLVRCPAAGAAAAQGVWGAP